MYYSLGEKNLEIRKENAFCFWQVIINVLTRTYDGRKNYNCKYVYLHFSQVSVKLCFLQSLKIPHKTSICTDNCNK
jgi:hypothetical protein